MSGQARRGGCLCGALRYETNGPFGPIWNCHCAFCRRIHGAAFTTVAMMARTAFQWSDGSDEPTIFKTPMGSIRHFCGRCATPICNFPSEPAVLCLIVSSLDDELDESPWAHVNLESRAPWFHVGDDLPRFPAYPDDKTFAELIEKHSH
jgi:hypothetical protein